MSAVDASLRPDNLEFPSGMDFSQRKRGQRLTIFIGIDRRPKDFETLISTLDELVSHIYSATSALEKAEAA